MSLSQGNSNGGLAGQFLLSREQRHVRDGWRARCQLGWHLHTHLSLGVSDVVGPGGETAGWLLGYPIESARQAMLIGPWRLTHTPCAANARDIERQLYTLAGRYVLVLLGENLRRLYLDPCGTLSLVYSVTDLLAGSTSEVLGDKELADSGLVERISSTRETSGTWYPCGLTPWRNLRVLPPNHYLDVDGWTIRRHWPTSEPTSVSNRSQCLDVVEAIAARITGNIRAVVDTYPTVMTLTAGRDTRMLLSCARTMIGQLLFVTSGTLSDPLTPSLQR
jgi:hypothetical protein